MRTFWDPAGWLDAGPGGAGWSLWLDNARLAANLVIVAASLSIARVLLFHGRGTPRAPRLLVAFAVLAVLCGVAHLAVLLSAADSPPHVVPTLTKAMAAVFWVITAVHTPRLAAHLTAPPVVGRVAPGRADLLQRVERLRDSARRLETMLHGETGPLENPEALAELRQTLADLEAETCKI
jgi:hypothetical protein